MGNASMNIVNTGAIKDIGQLMACENTSDRVTPKVSRKIRRLATRPSLTIAIDVTDISDAIKINRHRLKYCLTRFEIQPENSENRHLE